MKSTLPTHYLLVLGIICSHLGVALDPQGFSDTGIPNVKTSQWGSKPTGGPSASGFALQWNIGYIVFRPFSFVQSVQPKIKIK